MGAISRDAILTAAMLLPQIMVMIKSRAIGCQ